MISICSRMALQASRGTYSFLSSKAYALGSLRRSSSNSTGSASTSALTNQVRNYQLPRGEGTGGGDREPRSPEKSRQKSVSNSDPGIFIVYHTTTCIIGRKPVNFFGMNQYLIGDKTTGLAALVDCGDPNPEVWVEFAEQHNLKISMILQTHAHIDHVMGIVATKQLMPDVPIYMHPLEKVWIQGVELNPAKGVFCFRNVCTLWSRFVLGFMIRLPGVDCQSLAFKTDHDIQDEDTISLGNLHFRVLFTPGHCPGHVVFHCATERVAFVGDLIFDQNIGRTDFVYCDANAQMASLRRIANDLPPETILFPGHMNQTTLQRQIFVNSFLKQAMSNQSAFVSRQQGVSMMKILTYGVAIALVLQFYYFRKNQQANDPVAVTAAAMTSLKTF